jgi:hypothetical protein
VYFLPTSSISGPPLRYLLLNPGNELEDPVKNDIENVLTQNNLVEIRLAGDPYE